MQVSAPPVGKTRLSPLARCATLKKNMEPLDDTHDDSHQDTSRYSLDVDAIAGRFQAAGFSFSPRSASRWCARDRLDCILLPIESGRIEKYFATHDSVDTEIEKMRRFQNVATARHNAPNQDTTSHGEIEQGKAGIGERESVPLQALTDKLAQVEDDLQDAVTRAAGHKAVAIQMRKDRDQAYLQLRATDRAVGVLQQRLMKLGGDPMFPVLPPPTEADDDPNAGDAPRATGEDDEPKGDNSNISGPGSVV